MSLLESGEQRYIKAINNNNNTVGGGRTTSLSDTDFLVQRVGVVSCFYSCVCMCVGGWVGGGWGAFSWSGTDFLVQRMGVAGCFYSCVCGGVVGGWWGDFLLVRY